MLTFNRHKYPTWSFAQDVYFNKCVKKGVRLGQVRRKALHKKKQCRGFGGVPEAREVQQCNGENHKEGFIEIMCKR